MQAPWIPARVPIRSSSSGRAPFVAFNTAFAQFLFASAGITTAITTILQAAPFYERAKPILRALPEVDTKLPDPGDLRGRVEVHHLYFRYDPDGPLVLDDVSLRAEPGEFIAIIGPSGAGKSSLFRQLLGFEEPESGSVFFDDQDLAGLNVQAVRHQMGVVLQNGRLMSGTVYQNIAGVSELSMEGAWEAARMAGLDRDIEMMPMGMFTFLGEGASTISGGQRQRLMIARAIAPLYHAVDNVWLEFDVDGPPPDVPVPSIFFAPQSKGQMDDIQVAGEPNAEGRLATVERTIRLLAGGEPPPRMLERCFRALSSDEKVGHVGLMLSRGEDAVRLCIRLRSVERIMEYLTEVGWPGNEADLRGVLEPLARSVDRAVLAIDVGDAVRPKIGLECYFYGNKQPRREPRWGAFLNSLVLSGLCTADKREALLAYPGYVDEAAQTAPWPAALRRASQLLGGRSLSTFVRSLHHVKILYRTGEPLEAKAYLAGNHHWHTPALRG